MTPSADTSPAPARSRAKLLGIGVLALALFCALVALGSWQLQRRVWKLALIERVEHRVHAAPVAPPPPAAWATISREGDEYRRVRLEGVYDPARQILVQAVTRLGSGYWVLTPLRADQGFTVLVNRGFVAADRLRPGAPGGHVQVTGLLRMTEPRGGFLRANDPAAGRWFSRDVAAIAQAKGLTRAAPYFVDAEASPDPAAPVGGLTVISFPNSHLVYAFTWFGLAAMVAGGMGLVVRDYRRHAPVVSRRNARAEHPPEARHAGLR